MKHHIEFLKRNSKKQNTIKKLKQYRNEMFQKTNVKLKYWKNKTQQETR